MSNEVIACVVIILLCLAFIGGYLAGMDSDISNSVRNLSKLMDYDRMKEENEHLQEALNIKEKRRR